MGMESAYIPLIMGGLGAMQGGLGGGDQEPFLLEPYGGYPGAFLDPRRMLTQNVRDVAHLGAIMGERAAAPVSLPGTFMQPSQWYSGGGLPFPMGRTAMDPSLFAPDVHQARPGAKFAEPEYVTGWISLPRKRKVCLLPSWMVGMRLGRLERKLRWDGQRQEAQPGPSLMTPGTHRDQRDGLPWIRARHLLPLLWAGASHG